LAKSVKHKSSAALIIGCVDFLPSDRYRGDDKEKVKKREESGGGGKCREYVTDTARRAAQRTGRNNVWRVLRQLWYAKFCFGPSCRSLHPLCLDSDKSEYIKEPRLRECGGGGRAEGLKKRLVLDETQFPTRSLRLSSGALHFVTGAHKRMTSQFLIHQCHWKNS